MIAEEVSKESADLSLSLINKQIGGGISEESAAFSEEVAAAVLKGSDNFR